MPRQERDDIMMWVANDEYFYNQVMRLYDRWVDEGDAWGEKQARREAFNVITEVAQALQSRNIEDGEYTISEINGAVEEVLEDFEDYREEEIAERQKKAAAKPVERKPMDAGDVEYAKSMDDLLLRFSLTQLPNLLDHPVNIDQDEAKRIGVEVLQDYIPASREKVRHALETGDEHLNTIKLRLWDEAAERLGYQKYRLRAPDSLKPYRMTLSDAVGLLKHVAKWHYA